MVPGLYDRKLGFWEMFRGSWVIFSSQIKYLFILVFGISVVLKALDFLFSGLVPVSVSNPWIAGWLDSFFYQLFGFVPAFATILVVKQCLESKNVSYGTLWNELSKIFWVGMGAHLVYQVVTLLQWGPRILLEYVSFHSATETFVELASIVIGTALMGYFFFYQHSIVFRNQGALSCFAYSFRVVRGRWWRVFGMMILFSLLTIFPLYILSAFLFKIIPVLSVPEKMKLAAPLFSFVGSFFNIFASVYFLNLDRNNLEAKRHPVDPVNPVNNF